MLNFSLVFDEFKKKKISFQEKETLKTCINTLRNLSQKQVA